ncbi:MAG: hypothetical protein NWF06_07500 [Candidatus Bathyarchaeota archaeon]|nr:hypothetical protein [Candidatus Bathyarchaeum sp.]
MLSPIQATRITLSLILPQLKLVSKITPAILKVSNRTLTYTAALFWAIFMLPYLTNKITKLYVQNKLKRFGNKNQPSILGD